MEKSFDREIIRRTLVALNLKNVNDIARLAGISQQNLNGYIKRGTFLKVVDSELYKRKINIEWIKTGIGEMLAGEPRPGIFESMGGYNAGQQSPPTPAGADTAQTGIGTLIEQTMEVLKSNTKYGQALKENIEAFHMAVQVHNTGPDLAPKKQQGPMESADRRPAAERKKKAVQ